MSLEHGDVDSASNDTSCSDLLSIDGTSNDSASTDAMSTGTASIDQDPAVELDSRSPADIAATQSRIAPDSTQSPRESKSARQRKSAKWLTDESMSCERVWKSSRDWNVGRTPQPVNCGKCRYKCTENIDVQQRHAVCQSFHNLGDVSRQRDFVRTHIVESKPKTIMADAKEHRTVSRFYYLPINGRKLRVCCKFFCKTLDVTTWAVEKWMKSDALPVAADQQRSQHEMEQWKKAVIQQHISAFPTMKSRNRCGERFLDANLSLSTMYRHFVELWTTLCQERDLNNAQIVARLGLSMESLTVDDVPSELAFASVFNECFKLRFSGRRYNRCEDCLATPGGTTPDDCRVSSSDYVHHRKHAAAERERGRDVERMVNSANRRFLTATVDLRNYLPIPCVNSSSVYKRKLFLHNITVRDGFNKGICYVWLETEGKYGVSELGSVIYRYLADLTATTVTDVSLFIQTPVQAFQKQRLVALLMYAANSLSLNSIELKFVVSESNLLDNDSLQLAVKHANVYLTAFAPHDWINVIKGARHQDPYDVKHLKIGDFYNLRALANQLLPNRTMNTNDELVNWSEVVCIRADKSRPMQISYKVDLDQGDYCVAELKPAVISNLSWKLQQLYSRHLSISRQKKQDLIALCASNNIPDIYHSFYWSLPCGDHVTDEVPDFTEEAESGDADESVNNESYDNDRCVQTDDSLTSRCKCNAMTAPMSIGHVHVVCRHQPRKRRYLQNVEDDQQSVSIQYAYDVLAI